MIYNLLGIVNPCEIAYNDPIKNMLRQKIAA